MIPMPDFSFELLNPEALDYHKWDDLIAGLPHAHVLQTAEWGQIKSQFGWQRLPVVWKDFTGEHTSGSHAVVPQCYGTAIIPTFKLLIRPKRTAS